MSKTELIKPEDPQPVTTKNEGAVILAMIDKLSDNPNISVERIEQMFNLYKTVDAEKARKEYWCDRSAMVERLPILEKVAQGAKAKYAPYDELKLKINPIMSEFGFADEYHIENCDDGEIRVTCILGHRSGHTTETSFKGPPDQTTTKDGRDVKTAIQAMASTVSYFKRYTLSALLGLATKDEDKDGGKGSDKTITDDQADNLRSLIAEAEANVDGFLKVAKVESVPDIRAKDFQRLHALLLQKKAANLKKEAAK